MPQLPLFPLNTVLFPGMALPLHIFEERYRLMIGRCIEERSAFGVVLIRSGEEVGGDAEPHEIGCTAQIGRFQRLPEGRLNLVAVGWQRFRIDALDRSQPYLSGGVTYLEDEGLDSPALADAAERVKTLFVEQFRLVLAITGQWTQRMDVPDAAPRLADFVAANVELEAALKQELLETLSVPARLEREAELLTERIAVLDERWEERRREKFAGAALN